MAPATPTIHKARATAGRPAGWLVDAALNKAVSSLLKVNARWAFSKLL